jgi:hypothetical protein
MQFANYALRLREGGRADVPDTCSPKFRRVTLPIGFAHPKLGSKSFEGARTRRRNSKGCGSIPSRSEKFGETRRSFLIFPCGKGIMRRRLFAALALAQARKTEANSDRIECRPEGNLNRFIVSKLVEIHKAKARGRIEFIAFLFSGLRVIWGEDFGARCGNRRKLGTQAFIRAFSSDRSGIGKTAKRLRRSNAHGHYDVAVAGGFIACGAELACGLFVF